MARIPSQELTLLLDAILQNKYAAPNTGVEQEKLFNLVYFHQIRPIFASFAHTNNLDIVFKRRLATDCQQITLANMLGTQELVRVCTILRQNQIPVFAYKGSIWASWLYDNLGQREFGDIDLLIPQEHFIRAIHILSDQAGFGADDYRNYLLDSELRNKFFKTDYHIPMTREEDGIEYVLEAHWQIAYPRLLFDFPSREWDLFSADYPMLGETLTGFSREYQFLILLVHHGGKEEWRKLKYVADLAAYMHRYGSVTDWELVSKLASAKGILKLLEDSLGMLKGLGIKWQESWPKSITPKDCSGLLHSWETMPIPPANSTWPYFKQGLKIHDGLWHKGRLIFRHLKYFSELDLLWHKTRWYRNNPS